MIMKKVYGIIAIVSLFALASCGEKVTETIDSASDTATNVVENVADTAADVVADTTETVVETTQEVVEVVSEVSDDLPTEEASQDEASMMESDDTATGAMMKEEMDSDEVEDDMPMDSEEETPAS